MKKLASFLIGLIIALSPTVHVRAQGLRAGGKGIQALSAAPRLAPQLLARINVIRVATVAPVTIPAKLLASSMPSSAAAIKGSSLTQKVTKGVANAQQNKLVDITALNFTPKQALQTLHNFTEAAKTGSVLPQEQGFFLNGFPHLTLQRDFVFTPDIKNAALSSFRRTLNAATRSSSTSADAWGRNMAAISNLGIYGTATDTQLILAAAKAAPSKFAPYTDVITARAFISLEAFDSLKALVELRTVNGSLPAHWQGIAEYAQKHALPVEFPAVADGKVAVLQAEAKNSLTQWNALNKYQTDLSAEATENWTALREQANASIISDEAALAVMAETPVTAANPPPTATLPNAKVSLAKPPLRHHLFEDSTGRPGALGQFCNTQGIDFQNKTLGEITRLISTNPVYRKNFITQISRNSSDIVYKLIKGLRDNDFLALQKIYPPTGTETFGPQLGEDILALLNAATAAETAPAVTALLNKGYIFISHFRGKRIYLGTEFNSAELPAIAEHLKDYNKANGIGRAEFVETFSANAGHTTVEATAPGVTIFPDRVFIFAGYAKEFTLADLPDFLRENPNAVLKHSSYKQMKDITYTNHKTGETVTKQGLIRLKQESLDEELRALENILKGDDTRSVLLLDKETPEENFRFMFERLAELKPLVETHLRNILGDTKLEISYRFGEHEIEGKGNLIPMANMHMHLEVYVPAIQFTYNVSVPLRASEQTKTNILKKFQEWDAKGRVKGSPIEYYGAPSVWEQVSQKTLRKIFPEDTAAAVNAPAAESEEMYEGEMALGFAF